MDDARRGPDLLEPWRQLYRAAGAFADGDVDALGLHRQWLADRQGSPGDVDGSRDGQAFYRQLAGWTTESARRAAGLAALVGRMAPRCGELVREVPRKMVAGGPPADPLELTLRLYEATNGPLSAMIQDVLTDEAFLQLSRRLLENWATVESLLARLSEGAFRRLQLATTSDTTRVATLVVGLDDKVDRLEDTIDALEAKLDRAQNGAHEREGAGR